jgi:hypothetical protein
VEIVVGDGAKKTLDIDRDLGHTFTSPSGIGDEAYAEDYAIFVRAWGVWVSIHLVSLDDAANSGAGLQSLARTVVTRL